jgi:hypothetical protein
VTTVAGRRIALGAKRGKDQVPFPRRADAVGGTILCGTGDKSNRAGGEPVHEQRGPVLSFDVNPGNGDDISVHCTLNNEDILKQVFDVGRDGRAWQAVVPKNLPKASGNS